MEKSTQVQVSKETRKKLKKIKITKLETYDEVILRLLEIQKGDV